MKTDKLRNRVKKATTITTNDPKAQTKRVFLGGEVKPLLEFKPKTIKLSGLAADEKQLDFEILRGSDLSVEILSIEATRKLVEVVSIDEIEAGAKYSVSLRAAPGDKPKMDRDTLKFRLRTSDGQERETLVAALVEHLDRVVISPRRNIVFRKQQTAPLKTGAKTFVAQSLFLTAAKPGIKFNVRSLEIQNAPPGLFEAEFKELVVGERYRVTVKLVQFQEVPNIRGKLLVHLDDGETSAQEINLFAQFIDQPRRGLPRARPGKGAGGTKLDPRTQLKKSPAAGKGTK